VRIDREAAPKVPVIHARLHDKAYVQQDQAEQQIDYREPLAGHVEFTFVYHLVFCDFSAS
jgi:hypothetical protein